MDHNQRSQACLMMLMLAALGMAGCRTPGNFVRPMPRLLPPQPTLEQVISMVNDNSSRIQSFSTDKATISASGSPTLRANIAMERPFRLRLQADTALTLGPELDLGSNDERFWFWFRGDPQRSLYYCRHDQFAQSAARQAIPIAPAELIDALGLAQFDPALPHQGPNARADGKLEVRTIRETSNGPVTKITVVDPRGWIAEQHFYDARGQLALSTVASKHRRDPLSNLIMPKVVDVNCPQQDFRLRINLGNVQINTPLTARPDLWTMPQYEGTRLVDLGDPNIQLEPTPAAASRSYPANTSSSASRRMPHRRRW